jgi:hypothetical protein
MSRFTQWWSARARARSTKIVVIVGGLVAVLAALAVLAGSDKSATTTTTATAVAQVPAVTPEATQTGGITATTQPRWKEQRAPTTEPPPPTTQRPTTTAPATTTQPPTTLPPTTTAPAAPRWVTVASLAGSAQKTGGYFRLTGAPARLSYKVEGEIVAFSIYVMAVGKILTSDGGVPEVTVTQAAQDTTRLMRDPGRYYLVAESNSPYSVTVEELR